jgi:VanZ family protein
MKPAWRWTAAVACAAGIFALSSLPGPDIPKANIPHLDKAAHLVIYFIFAGLLWWALRGSEARWPLTVAVVVAALYGVTDEVHQHFVPGRTMSFFDWLADAAGACLWVAVLRFRSGRAATPPRQPQAP